MRPRIAPQFRAEGAAAWDIKTGSLCHNTWSQYVVIVGTVNVEKASLTTKNPLLLAQWNISFWEWDLNLQSPFPMELLGHPCYQHQHWQQAETAQRHHAWSRSQEPGRGSGWRRKAALRVFPSAAFWSVFPTRPEEPNKDAMLDKEAPIEQAYRPISSPPATNHCISQVRSTTQNRRKHLPTQFFDCQFFGCPT